MKDPLALSKEDLQKVIKVIHSEKSQVGIDAQYTHAIIIQYLKNIEKRLDLIEKKLV